VIADMRRRPCSCLALALLLLWQLGSAVAVGVPRAAAANHGSAAVVEHCARHATTGTADANQPPGGAQSPGPGCCHHGAGDCQCAQMAALPMPLLAFGDVRPPDAPAVPPGAPRVAARPGDFFRPPI
jgi:hypothetical protein